MIINPIVVFYVTSGLLIFGAMSLNSGNSIPPEVIWISIFLIVLVAANRLMPARREQKLTPTGFLEVDIYCVSVLSLGGLLFLLRGIPLLSSDPNVARVEFFADGGVLAKGFALIPTVIAICTIAICGRGARRSILYGSIAGLELLLAGNKAALLNIVLPVIIGFWCAGRRIPLRILVLGGFAVAALTIFLFATIVNESESSESVLSLFLSRVTTTNAYGLRLCVDYSGAVGSHPPLIAFQSIADRLSGIVSGYPISTGRYLTTIQDSYSSFYDSVWELTVTGYCDSYLVGGTPSVAIYIILMSTGVVWILRRMDSTSTLLGNAANSLAFLHLFLVYNSGNIAAQILGFIGQDWILFVALIFIAKFGARLVLRFARTLPAQSPARSSARLGNDGLQRVAAD